MKNFINLVCMPLVLFAAVNYGLVGAFRYDLLGLLPSGLAVQIAQIAIGLAGLGLATGWYGRK
jgi:uncharacterized membrane protein YuzA (DUF378 family)